MRMYSEFDKLITNKLTINSESELPINHTIFNIPINTFLNVENLYIGSKKPIEINIICLNKTYSNINIKTFYNGIVLGKHEYLRYDDTSIQHMMYRYGIIDLDIGNNHININNNVIIDNIIVYGKNDILSSVKLISEHEYESKEYYTIDLINSDCEYNIFYDECHRDDKILNNVFYYFSKGVEHDICGKLLPCKNRFIDIEQRSKYTSREKIKCIIRYECIYEYSNKNVKFEYNFEVNEKSELFDEYKQIIKSTDLIKLNTIIKTIKESTNTYPLTYSEENTYYYEGYWFSDSRFNNIYPIPIIGDESIDPIFIEKIDKYMDEYEDYRDICFKYLGSSCCRICDKCHNGSNEYKIIYEDKVIFFPSGLIHYYRDHNVKPSIEFYNAIMGL
jgi:hypothetical protein